MRYLMIAALIAFGVSPRAQETVPMGPNTALLVIDIQNFYFEKGSLPLTGSVEAARQAARVIETFRANTQLVVHVRHTSKTTKFEGSEPVDAQYRFHPAVAPAAGEMVITKHYANSFR